MKLTRQEKAVIRKLEKLEESWPKSLQLFAQSGMLLLIHYPDLTVIDTFSISCDGGDAEYITDDDGIERQIWYK